MSKKHQRRPAALPREKSHQQPRHSAPAPTRDTSGSYWLYGWHAVNAALANDTRPVRRIIVSEAGAPRLKLPRNKLPEPQVMPAREMDHLLGRDALHQGIAALVAPLPGHVLEDVLHIQNPKGPLLILDQVSDPHNVGAILRSAAAFGAVAVITPKRSQCPETAVMAKAACGGLDIVPRISVTNLASAMRDLKAGAGGSSGWMAKPRRCSRPSNPALKRCWCWAPKAKACAALPSKAATRSPNCRWTNAWKA